MKILIDFRKTVETITDPRLNLMIYLDNMNNNYLFFLSGSWVTGHQRTIY